MDAPASTIIDTHRAVETPEGVELNLRLAGPVVRFYAWGIDLLIRLAVYIVLGIVLGILSIGLGNVSAGLFLVAVFLLEWFYPVYFELKSAGATPGKRRLGIRVLRDDGTEVDAGASVIRNLLRAADFLPLFYGFGLAAMLADRDFRRLGDLAAGTVVVYREQTPLPDTVPEAPPLAPPAVLTTAEQHALLQYAERAGELSPERAVELADLLQPLTGERGETGRHRLLQYANWLVGRR